MSEIDNLLNSLDDAFKTAQSMQEGFKLPDGDYLFMIENAEITKSKSSERIHVRMPCQVVDGPYTGMTHYSYDLRFTDSTGKPDMMGMGFFKAACQKLGIPVPANMSDAQDAVVQMPGRVFMGRIKTRDEFTNLIILRLIHHNHTEWVTHGCPMPDNPKAGDLW